MNRKAFFNEYTARGMLLVLLVGLALLVGLGRGEKPGDATVIYARIPEEGGWMPGALTVQAGEPLHLSLVSEDVVHGFAIGQSDQPPIDLIPGKPVETTLTFERPGRYTYYCTRWCGLNHWRMRGTIDVLPEHGQTVEDTSTSANPPLYVLLGLDIDASHLTTNVPGHRPMASRGAASAAMAPEVYTRQDYLRARSPAQVGQDLREEPTLSLLDDGQLWDLVAHLILRQTNPERLAQAKERYAQNCAACHGENGAGDGVMADALAGEVSTPDHGTGIDGHERQAPVNFTDPTSMLGASPAVLHGKIVRGGMGTGMPYWGPIFMDDQIWALVEYLWTFQFDL